MAPEPPDSPAADVPQDPPGKLPDFRLVVILPDGTEADCDLNAKPVDAVAFALAQAGCIEDGLDVMIYHANRQRHMAMGHIDPVNMEARIIVSHQHDADLRRRVTAFLQVCEREGCDHTEDPARPVARLADRPRVALPKSADRVRPSSLILPPHGRKRFQ